MNKKLSITILYFLLFFLTSTASAENRETYACKLPVLKGDPGGMFTWDNRSALTIINNTEFIVHVAADLVCSRYNVQYPKSSIDVDGVTDFTAFTPSDDNPSPPTATWKTCTIGGDPKNDPKNIYVTLINPKNPDVTGNRFKMPPIAPKYVYTKEKPTTLDSVYDTITPLSCDSINIAVKNSHRSTTSQKCTDIVTTPSTFGVNKNFRVILKSKGWILNPTIEGLPSKYYRARLCVRVIEVPGPIILPKYGSDGS